MKRYVIVELESFEGEDTFLRCGDDHQDRLYCVVVVDDDNSAGVVDSAYRSYKEAVEAWPEAAIREEKRSETM